MKPSRCRDVTGGEKMAKVSIVGMGMRSHAGIAAKMFRTLAEEGINIQMISTSEIKITVARGAASRSEARGRVCACRG
jgi:aspartokinase